MGVGVEVGVQVWVCGVGMRSVCKGAVCGALGCDGMC